MEEAVVRGVVSHASTWAYYERVYHESWVCYDSSSLRVMLIMLVVIVMLFLYTWLRYVNLHISMHWVPLIASLNLALPPTTVNTTNKPQCIYLYLSISVSVSLWTYQTAPSTPRFRLAQRNESSNPRILELEEQLDSSTIHHRRALRRYSGLRTILYEAVL